MCLSLGLVLILVVATPMLTSAQDQPQIGFWDECREPTNLSGDVVIGVIFSLSGNDARYGNPQQQGLLFAVDEINDSDYLGDAFLIPLIEDGGSTPDSARQAMTNLVRDDSVVAVIGPTLSSQAFAADPYAAEAGVPILSVSNTVADITVMNDDEDLDRYIFRSSLPEAEVIPRTIEVAVDDLGVQTVAILYGNDDEFTTDSYNSFVEALRSESVQILAEQTFTRRTTNFSASLTTLLATNPDALVVSAFLSEAVPIVTQARSLGFDGLIIGGDGFNSSAFLSDTGSASNNVIVGAAWNAAGSGEVNKAFVDAYNDAYGRMPDQFAAQAYTGTWLLATAVRCANSDDPSNIRQALADIEDFDSPLGEFTFDDDRNPVHEPLVQIVRNGQFEVIGD
jgi:branched-chain amino acid transport system substrate-binding protein